MKSEPIIQSGVQNRCEKHDFEGLVRSILREKLGDGGHADGRPIGIGWAEQACLWYGICNSLATLSKIPLKEHGRHGQNKGHEDEDR